MLLVSGCNFAITEAREKPPSNPSQAEGATESGIEEDAEKESVGENKEDDVMSMVKPSPVIGTISENADVYSTAGGKEVAGSLAKGTKVEIIRDKGYNWYYIKDNRVGLAGWVASDYLTIPSDPPTNQDRMTEEELESYVNETGFESATSYLVWVDIDRQLTHVFEGKKGEWELSKTLECSTGKNISPTLRGTFTIEDRGEWFYSPAFESGGKYWVRYNGAYMFHSVAMNKDQTIKDPTVGKRASAGCIRLPVDGAKWFYETVPFGTKVFIN